MKNGKLDRINLLKYLMVVLLIIYVVFLVTREGDNTVSVDTIDKNITKYLRAIIDYSDDNISFSKD